MPITDSGQKNKQTTFYLSGRVDRHLRCHLCGRSRGYYNHSTFTTIHHCGQKHMGHLMDLTERTKKKTVAVRCQCCLKINIFKVWSNLPPRPLLPDSLLQLKTTCLTQLQALILGRYELISRYSQFIYLQNW